MDEIALRRERSADEAAVRRAQVDAFGERGEWVGALLDDLRAASEGGSISLVATLGASVVGHVFLSPCLLDAPRELVPALVLSPLGVRTEHQNRGIGTGLVRAALEAAETALAPLVFLEGDPAYYGRFGFRAASELGVRRPSLRIPAAGFQAVALSRHADWMTGTMVYPDVWWRHDAVGLRDRPGPPAQVTAATVA